MLKIHRGITNDTKIGKTLPILIFKLCGVLVFNFSLTLITMTKMRHSHFGLNLSYMLAKYNSKEVQVPLEEKMQTHIGAKKTTDINYMKEMD